MRIKTILVYSLLSLSFLPALHAREFWNGSECVRCPEHSEYVPGESNQPGGNSSGSGQAGSSPEQLALLLNNSAMISPTLQNQTHDLIAANDDPALLYFITGPIKNVDVDRHKIVVKNRRNHKLENIYVYDPIISHLKERNVVEVWIKPGSDLAERIHRVS